MRWIRFLFTLLSARSRSNLSIDQESRIPFRVWITDVDVSIMNHAAMMSVMEMGRIDFMVRTGFLRLAQKNKWYFPSSSINVQFFRPLKMFEKALVVTKVFYTDERSIYLEQKIIRENKMIAACIVKSTIRKGREQINILEVLKIFNNIKAPQDGQDIIEHMEKGNKLVKERLS